MIRIKCVGKWGLLLGFIFFCILSGFAQSFDYYPTSSSENKIEHSYYALSYIEAHEQAEWVAYELLKNNIGGKAKRTNNFRSDPLIVTGSADLLDYQGSGYDRGHLAPAADMAFSSSAMSESFFLSNMSPQDPSFNRGVWKRLEEQVRTWAVENEHLYVITGPVLSESVKNIGPNKVTVPSHFYKVILDYKAPEIKAIALVLPNEKSQEHLSSYAVTIDYLEKLTGIDFFPSLPDDMEMMLESRKDVSRWSFTQLNISTNRNVAASIQCRASEVSSGTRCRNWTKRKNGYCNSHQPQQTQQKPRSENKRAVAIRCVSSAKSGVRCKRETFHLSGKCWQHQLVPE